jgi:hypothetical protein
MANVRFVRLSAENTLDVVAYDMLRGEVLLFRPSQSAARPRLLSKPISHPAHAEVADLDRDGIKDLLIANLGTPLPSEMRLGSVVWLKGRPDGSFATLTLASELGRVTDVEPADFDGDGNLDLVVASFGRLTLGEVLLLENRTRDRSSSDRTTGSNGWRTEARFRSSRTRSPRFTVSTARWRATATATAISTSRLPASCPARSMSRSAGPST